MLWRTEGQSLSVAGVPAREREPNSPRVSAFLGLLTVGLCGGACGFDFGVGFGAFDESGVGGEVFEGLAVGLACDGGLCDVVDALLVVAVVGDGVAVPVLAGGHAVFGSAEPAFVSGALLGGERGGVVGVFQGPVAEDLTVLGDLDLACGVAFGLVEECFFGAAVAFASGGACGDGGDEGVVELGGEWHGLGSFPGWCRIVGNGFTRQGRRRWRRRPRGARWPCTS